MTYGLPRTLTLPSGLRVTLRAAKTPPTPRAAGLFADVLALGVSLRTGDGVAVALDDLVLADFHVVRAVLAKAGCISEEEESIPCPNCEAALSVKPCARLESGPWEDDEANDPELDATGPFGTPTGALAMVLAQRTVREARVFWEADTPLDVTPEIVTALGIVRLGRATAPGAIADALDALEDDAFDAVASAWLDAHYPLRLGADVICPTCGARSTIDAPAVRELDRASPRAHDGGPELVAFVERAHAIAEPLLAAYPDVELVVDDGTPAVDDGGEPLLGGYLPPPPEGAATPARAPLVTIYWRTFVACVRDEASFDWEDELRETIEHELEHHAFFLDGHDPMDEEERAAIVDDELRIVGKRAAERRAMSAFGGSFVDFARRAWPLILVAVVVLAISIAESRCAE